MWGCDLCRTVEPLGSFLDWICTWNSRLWANLRLWQRLQNPFPMCFRTENGKSCTHKPHLPQTFLHLPVAILMLGNKWTSLPMVVDSWGLHLLTPPKQTKSVSCTTNPVSPRISFRSTLLKSRALVLTFDSWRLERVSWDENPYEMDVKAG